MFRGAAKTFAMSFVVVVVMGVSPSLALPHNPFDLTRHEMSASILVNQLAILKNMNEPTYSFASHDDELSQLREDMNKVNDDIQGINETLQTDITEISETMNNDMQRLNETAESRERAINEMNTKIQSMDRNIQGEVNELGEKIETEIQSKIDSINQTVYTGMGEIKEMLEAAQNAIANHHQRPDPADLYAQHNDSSTSSCDGHKVLYGGRGGIEVTSTTYRNNTDCSWTVTLPKGTRPVFRWYKFDIQRCDPCRTCDYVRIDDPNHNRRNYYYCGKDAPNGNYLTIMNNKFKVEFHSDGSTTASGFKLLYRAVERS